ncbi:hypothetical protein IBX73_04760 [candidate division WOR-3 bacterium]|nr:hypothetical protein [candidate division WOR-3 bacterium]
MKMHPVDELLHDHRLASAWCAGCGIGTVVGAFLAAVTESGIGSDLIRLVSGIGCTERAAGCVNLRTCRAGRQCILDHAADLKLADPGSHVIALMNNADLLVSGARDLDRAVRRGARLLVIHINNVIYVSTRHGLVANTPYTRPSWDRRFEIPYNIPDMAVAYGASYVARWTQLHAGWMKYSIIEALSRDGVSLVEVVSPCLVYDADSGGIGESFERIRIYNSNTSFMKAGVCHRDLDIRNTESIIIGNLFDQDVS